MTAYLTAMQHYFDFRSRATRSQYWLFTLSLFVLSIIGAVLDGALFGQPGPMTGLITLVHLIPSLAVSVRRLHDINRSGWWILIGIVPLAGLIVLLVFACTASTPGSNRFGPQNGASIQPPATPPVGTVPMLRPDGLDQLEKLAALRSNGTIDEPEFQRLKSQWLA